MLLRAKKLLLLNGGRGGSFAAGATLYVDSVNQLYYRNGVRYARLSDIPNLVYTGGAPNGVYEQNADGTLTLWANNVPREPTGVGVSGWEARTNSIRNGQGFGGAVATLPTNWFTSGGASGITIAVTAVGTENGLPYTEVRFSGTANGSVFPAVYFESNTNIAAVSGQVWTGSMYVKLQSGSMAALNPTDYYFTVQENTAAGAYVANTANTVKPTATFQKLTNTRTLNGGTTAFITMGWGLGLTLGVAVDFTLRFYGMQLEQGAYATPYIPTTNAAATRNVDALAISSLAPGAALTLFGDVTSAHVATANEFPLSWDDNTGNNRMQFFHGPGAPIDLLARSVVGGVATNPADIAGGLTNNGRSKIAMAVAAGRAMSCANGFLSGAAGAPVSIPPATTLHIGANEAASTWNGYVRRVAIYPTAYTDAQLQALTA